MLRLAVFVSGRGSNLRAILNAKSSNYLNIEIKALFSDKDECLAVELAKANSIPFYFVSKYEKAGYIKFESLSKLLDELEIDLVVLAGFLKKIPDEIVEKYQNRIINIHPALLPSFGGEGMYGLNVHRAVFNSSAKISGASVHFVDKIYDHGKIIAQKAVDISDVQTPEDIAERVLKVEHELLPFVIKKISEDKILITENRVFIIN
ncbi:MAG: phosphoribosylglycinamide formyltransferase [Ignavibacteriales bacterium]|nr:phosphoribosylglycinamide formyltransferase [Ignavibacteriales bacterium]